jgi:hypothetical protein
VHFHCLKKWIDSKIKKKVVGDAVTYNWKKSECELCKASLPKKVVTKSNSYEMIDIDRPSRPYIILESLAKEKKVSKSLFVICGTQETIKLVLS